MSEIAFTFKRNKLNRLNKLYARIDSSLPLRLFIKKLRNYIQIALQLMRAMDFFADFAAIFKRLGKIGPKAFHSC